MTSPEHLTDFQRNLQAIENLYQLERAGRFNDRTHFAYHRLLSKAVAALGDDAISALAGIAETGDADAWGIDVLVLSATHAIHVSKSVNADGEGTARIYGRSSLLRLEVAEAPLITSDHILASRDDTPLSVTLGYDFGEYTLTRVSHDLLAGLKHDVAVK